MEQTLGKRIVHHRKKLGLTQDQLAEQLGVTAQAVSKWENDQSCPDITMLPKLASIFGITTDMLLGSAPEETVTASQVTVEDSRNEDDDREEDGLHIQRGNWEFKWDAGRRGSLTVALLVLSIGGQLLAARILDRDIGFWSITWPSVLLVLGIMGMLRRVSFGKLGAVLVGGYFILDNFSLLPFTVGSELIFPLLLLLFGLSLLLDAFKRPKKPKCSFKRKGSKHSDACDNPGKQSRNFSEDDGFISYNGSFGDDRQYVALPLLTGGEICTSFGDFTIDLSGVEAVSDGCKLVVNGSFGDTTVLVPRKFTVKASTSASFADVSVNGHPDPESQGTILVDANASFGDISIRYI